MRIVVTKVYCKTDSELESAIAKNNYKGYYDFIGATSVYGEHNAMRLKIFSKFALNCAQYETCHKRKCIRLFEKV